MGTINNEQLINNNQNKYKKTEIGEIPKEWEVKEIGEIGSTYNGLSGKNKDDFGRGKPFIPYKNIFDNSKIDINYLDYVVIKDDENQNKVKYGDIFFTTSSETPEEVGMSSVILDEIDELYLNSFCFGFRLNDFSILLPEFARYLFRGGKIRKIVSRLAQGSTRFNLSKTQFMKISIPIPPLKEQQKIASILSTVDEQIEQTDVLIEKTKELKKGLMQKLLTKGIGHTEFKKTEIGEIPKEWEVIPLFDTGEYINGKAFKPSEWRDEGIPIIRIQNLNDKNATYNYYNLEVDKKYHVNKGDLLFAWSGSIGLHIWKEEKAYLNQHIYKVIPSENVDKKYLYYQLSRQIEILLELSHGSTMKHITRKNLKLVKIPLPSPKEQQKIATILSEVDNQIEEYEIKKEKLQNLKKGLMQQLLTGKKRVKV
ncbi:restriction endonuclease subunit S [Thermohalobacter berrensis]|uniref:Type I restriction modification DNA specificity domain-containing protein n=1 Tax=Thermohalobacter berrensis TaxID=99594 RepID=A0A419T9M2_9FIRM|nr:restriction endonuclease subunit S [Thermohalobacter berrensis]RKD34169.1 hypothetical protein BET03_07720 [Thermohalobacter berrensis]